MPTTYPLTWDSAADRKYETGLDHGALYVYNTATNKYGADEAYFNVWNGLTSVSESPDGADITELYADNMKYLSLQAAENFKATVEAYTYPKQFNQCDGVKELDGGVYVNLQSRATFGLYYRTKAGDANGTEWYKHHFIYGCKVTPSDKSYETVNDSPSAITFSWEIDSTPVTDTISATGFEAGTYTLSMITIDENELTSAQKSSLNSGTLYTKLFGTSSTPGELPLPNDLFTALGQ